AQDPVNRVRLVLPLRYWRVTRRLFDLHRRDLVFRRRHLEAQLGVLLRRLDLLAGELARRHGVLALDTFRHVLVGDALHLQRMQAAEFGDLLEGQRGVVDQPDGGRLGHKWFVGHRFSLSRARLSAPSLRSNVQLSRKAALLAVGATSAQVEAGCARKVAPNKESRPQGFNRSLPIWALCAIRAWAAPASASGNTLSTTGLILPASMSGQTSRRTASRIAPFSSLERARKVVAIKLNRFISIEAKFTSATMPFWNAMLTMRPQIAAARKFFSI